MDAGVDVGGAGHQCPDLRPGQSGTKEESVLRLVRSSGLEDRAAGMCTAAGGAVRGSIRMSLDIFGYSRR